MPKFTIIVTEPRQIEVGRANLKAAFTHTTTIYGPHSEQARKALALLRGHYAYYAGMTFEDALRAVGASVQLPWPKIFAVGQTVRVKTDEFSWTVSAGTLLKIFARDSNGIHLKHVDGREDVSYCVGHDTGELELFDGQ